MSPSIVPTGKGEEGGHFEKLADEEREAKLRRSLTSKLEKRMKKRSLILHGGLTILGAHLFWTLGHNSVSEPHKPPTSERPCVACLRCSVQTEGLRHHCIKPTCDRTKIANTENQTAGKNTRAQLGTAPQGPWPPP